MANYSEGKPYYDDRLRSQNDYDNRRYDNKQDRQEYRYDDKPTVKYEDNKRYNYGHDDDRNAKRDIELGELSPNKSSNVPTKSYKDVFTRMGGLHVAESLGVPALYKAPPVYGANKDFGPRSDKYRPSSGDHYDRYDDNNETKDDPPKDNHDKYDDPPINNRDTPADKHDSYHEDKSREVDNDSGYSGKPDTNKQDNGTTTKGEDNKAYDETEDVPPKTEKDKIEPRPMYYPIPPTKTPRSAKVCIGVSVTIIILLLIGGGVAIGLYFTNEDSTTTPTPATTPLPQFTTGEDLATATVPPDETLSTMGDFPTGEPITKESTEDTSQSEPTARTIETQSTMQETEQSLEGTSPNGPTDGPTQTSIGEETLPTVDESTGPTITYTQTEDTSNSIEASTSLVTPTLEGNTEVESSPVSPTLDGTTELESSPVSVTSEVTSP